MVSAVSPRLASWRRAVAPAGVASCSRNQSAATSCSLRSASRSRCSTMSVFASSGSGTVKPTRAASCRTASGNATLSYSSTNLITSPPTPQPKHLKNPLSPFTLNDGVFSPWNGHSPFHVVPARRRGTRSWMTCTISARDFRSSTNDGGNRAIWLRVDCRLQTADCRLTDCRLVIVDWRVRTRRGCTRRTPIPNPQSPLTIANPQSVNLQSAICSLQSTAAGCYSLNSTTVTPPPPCSGGAGAKCATNACDCRNVAMPRRSCPVP